VSLAPDTRARLLARTRGIVRTNYQLLRSWLDKRPTFSHVPPQAGAIAFVKYSHPIDSTTLVERLRLERGVLVVPGNHFGMDGYLRVGFGSHPDHLVGALQRIAEVMDAIAV